MSSMTITRYVCPVCLEKHEYGPAVHIDRRPEGIPDAAEYRTLQLCEEHQKMRDEGYCFLVEIVPPDDVSPYVDYGNADRTGNVMAIFQDDADCIFENEADVDRFGVTFIDEECYSEIHQIFTKDETRTLH